MVEIGSKTDGCAKAKEVLSGFAVAKDHRRTSLDPNELLVLAVIPNQLDVSRGEDTKRNFKHAKDSRRSGSAVALDDTQDGALAQPETVTYFPVRLASIIIRSLPELVT